MSYDYTENKLIQESAAELLERELGWQVQYAYNQEVLGEKGTFGRTSHREVLLKRYVVQALRKYNDWLTDEQLREAWNALEQHLASAELMQINQEKYNMIRDGIDVTVRRPDGTTTTKKAQLIDFNNPENNEFLAIKEMKIQGDIYNRRTDIVGFVNGIPLLFVELKALHRDVRNAYEDNYRDYLNSIPQLFYYNAMIIFSNGKTSKVGTLGSKYEFFHEWKRLKEEDEGNVELFTMLRGMCDKTNFLDLLENFILYDKTNGKTVKILARNHQFLGVNAAVEAYYQRKLRDGKLGVFWHTQGSGKSYSMVFMAKKILRKAAGTPTILVLTDRDELNNQILKTFNGCGLLENDLKEYIATSGENLITKLKGNGKFIFSLIQKFNQDKVPPIYPDHDILIMSDEAHRSQYGVFAENMWHLLPDTSRISIIGFTGTPLLKFDELTKRTFGGYISVYDFQRAVQDNATVPLYYDNRAVKLKNLHNPEITKEILEAIDAADLDVNQEVRLERELAKELHLLMNEPRLREVAKDFVEHYSDLWTTGKAMFVCTNRAECALMYQYVQEYWQNKIHQLQQGLQHSSSQQEALELGKKLQWMKETEMAVVVSQEQNEVDYFRKWGVDFSGHRQKMVQRDLEKEFKDDQNPFRVVFVCAMWLTGFDVPCLANLYLDKPMKAHSLMQAIARANRVFAGKANGLVVDYIGIIVALRKALADYTNQDSVGNDPVVDKEQLLQQIKKMVDDTARFMLEQGVNLSEIINNDNGENLTSMLIDAEDMLSKSGATRKNYLKYAGECGRLMKYANRGELPEDVVSKFGAIREIAKMLQRKICYGDNTELMKDIFDIVSKHVEVVPNQVAEIKQFDISKIDFRLLQAEFAAAKHKFLLVKELMLVTEEKLKKMLTLNPGRINYYVKYQKIIEEYNQNQDKAEIERIFSELTSLVGSLQEEERRYLVEGFKNEEELAIYDLLYKENLSKGDIKKIKEIAGILLVKIKAKLVEMDSWKEKENTKATMQRLIRDTLYETLPDSYDDDLQYYYETVYEYVYSHYEAA